MFPSLSYILDKARVFIPLRVGTGAFINPVDGAGRVSLLRDGSVMLILPGAMYNAMNGRKSGREVEMISRA